MSKSTIVERNPDFDRRLGEGAGEPLGVDELLLLPPFQHLKKRRRLLENNPGAVWLRRYESGEFICRQGEFGSTAFYILSGTVRISLRSAESAPTPKAAEKSNWFTRLLQRKAVAPTGFIPVD